MVKSPKTNKFWVLFSILLCRVGFWDFDSHSLSSSSFHIGISSSSNRAQRFGLSNYFSSERERERFGRRRTKIAKMAVRPGVLKAALGVMAVCLLAYIVGPPLYWHLMEGLASASASASCPSCNCECDSVPLLSIPQGMCQTLLC